MVKKQLKISLALLLLTAGCMWHLPLAGPEESAKYASLTPPEGKVLLYILREDVLEGGGIMSLVELNGRNFGIVKGGAYLVAALEPGRHTINVMLDKGQKLSLDMQAGQTYYVLHRLDMANGIRHAKLKKLGNAQGHSMIKNYKLSGKNYLLGTVQ